MRLGAYEKKEALDVVFSVDDSVDVHGWNLRNGEAGDYQSF
jgi:hypothetical protein